MYGTCNTQNRGGQKNPLTQKKNEEKEENERMSARHEMLAACDTFAFTTILLNFHRVLRMLIRVRTTC